MTLENLKYRKFSVTLAISNFQELFVINFDLKSIWFKIKIVFVKRFITRNNEEGENTPRVK